MRDHFWLSNEAWAALEPHLPKNQPGARRVDDRRVISGILHILKTGGRWRDVPPEYGPAKTIYNSREDAREVVARLGVDLVELSGGSYEAPAMMGSARDGRTLAREAYFLEFARDIATIATMPLMVTGDICRREVAQQVIDGGVAMAGIATVLAIEPDLPRNWRAGGADVPVLRLIAWKNKQLASAAHMAAVRYQMTRLSRRHRTAPGVQPAWALRQALPPLDARASACRLTVATAGISITQTFDQAKFGGMDVSDARRLKALEDENARLKRLLAEQMLDNAILKDVVAKNGDAHAKRKAVFTPAGCMG